jgi:ketosteroid isomerase-like protein
LHAHLGAVEWKTYRGPGALVKMWSDLEEAFGGTMQVEVTELIDCEHQVVAVVEALATGRKSGVQVRQSWAQLTTHRNGSIIRIEPFPDREAALKGAGQQE